MSVKVSLKFKGHGFSPKRFGKALNLPIRSITEAGEPLTYGPKKGKPAPNGYGILKVESESGLEQIEKYLDKLIEKRDTFKEYALDKIIVDIQSSTSEETSFEFSRKIISQLALINASVAYSAYDEVQDLKGERHKLTSHFAVKYDHPNERNKDEKANHGVFMSSEFKHTDHQNFLTYLKSINPNYSAAKKLNSVLKFYDNIQLHSVHTAAGAVMLGNVNVNKVSEMAALGLITGFLIADTGATVSIVSGQSSKVKTKKEGEYAIDLTKFLQNE